MTDAEGSHSSTYDDGGRMLSHAVTYTKRGTPPYSGIWYLGASADEGYDTVRFTLYDDAERLLRRIDGRDIVTEYEYDDPVSQGALQCTRGH